MAVAMRPHLLLNPGLIGLRVEAGPQPADRETKAQRLA